MSDEQPPSLTERAKSMKVTIPVRVVAYEGGGITLASGYYQAPEPRFDDEGRPHVEIADVKRALAAWLHSVAEELEGQVDITLDAQHQELFEEE